MAKHIQRLYGQRVHLLLLKKRVWHNAPLLHKAKPAEIGRHTIDFECKEMGQYDSISKPQSHKNVGFQFENLNQHGSGHFCYI
jgi:hypothetical protein